MTRVALGFVGLVCAVAYASLPAYAQTAAQRPQRALFGGGVGNTSQSLTLNVTFAGGRDTNFLGTIVPSDPSLPAPPQKVSSQFGQVSGALNYALSRGRFSFGANGSASDLYYPALSQANIPGYSAGVSSGLSFGRAGHLTFGDTVSYSPFYSLSTIVPGGGPGQGLPFLPDQTPGTFLENTLSNTAGVAYGVSLTPRISAGAGYAYNNQTTQSHLRDLSSQASGANIAYAITKYLSVSFGYTRTEYVTTVQGTKVRTVTTLLGGMGGLNYAKSISLSRRLTFSFSTGVGAGKDISGSSHYTLLGGAELVREIGRTWKATAAYNRNLGFSAAFLEPFVSDTVNLGFGGLISRRLSFASGAGAGRSSIGFNIPNNTAVGYSASATLNYGLSRNVGIGGSYTAYWSSFGAGVNLPPGVLSQSNRQTARVFLTFWEPLFIRRRADASR
jgi:hypothetical protein